MSWPRKLPFTFVALSLCEPQTYSDLTGLGGTPVTLHLYVEDVDDLFDRAVAAGASVIMPVADQFWGDRYGMLSDPFGHRWSIASRIEDLSPRALQNRAADWARKREVK